MVTAILLGLSRPVEHYPLKFPRVVVAYIAMKEPIAEQDADQAKEIMARRLSTYRNRDALRTLIDGAVDVVGNGLKITGSSELGDLATSIARPLVDVAWMSRRAGKDLLAAERWFRDQDLGLGRGPYEALVELSRRIAVDSETVRWDVEDLLVGALLADLRESMGEVTNRRRHALVLVDNGDTPAARAFTTALARVQSRALSASRDQRSRAIDPLVLVATSGGVLVRDLVRLPAPPAQLATVAAAGGPAPVPRPGCWFRVRLGDLAEAEVRSAVQVRQWPPDLALGSATISYLTHRLTGGHAAATALVLDALQQDPGQLGDLDKVLRGNAPPTPATVSARTPVTVEEHLFGKLVDGLQPDGSDDAEIGHALVTLSAARDRQEAATLSHLVPMPALEPLLASDDLWSGAPVPLPPLASAPVGGSWSPLVRYLGLRQLADRTGADAPTWHETFTRLRERTADPVVRLHHELALGNGALVVRELLDLLSSLDDVTWLGVLDQVTATPDPRRRFTLPGTVQIRPAVDPADVVARLVEAQHALSDPLISDPATVRYLCRRLDNDFGHLAGDSIAFLQRSQHYAHLAVAFS